MSLTAFLVAVGANAVLQSGFLEITGGWPVLDVAMVTDADDLYDLLRQYGEHGRREYLWFCAFDLVYPVVAGLFAALLAAWLVEKAGGGSRARWIPLLPIVVLAVDWAENLTIARLVLNYPMRMEAGARIAIGITWVKLALIAILIGALVVLGARAVVHGQWRQ